MKSLVYILNYIYIFVVRTVFNIYVTTSKKIIELTDWRRGASPSTLQNVYTLLDSVRSDQSAVRSKLKFIIMRTEFNGGNATASLLAAITIPAIAQTAANITTNVGFVKQYFNYLPNYETALEAFQAVNVEYYLLHKRFKFESFSEFRASIFNS